MVAVAFRRPAMPWAVAGIKGFERAQIGNADINLAADGGVVDVVAELLGDAERAVNFAEAGVAFQRAVDAAVLETGAQGECGKSQRLFVFRVFIRQDDVAALSADVEEAARVFDCTPNPSRRPRRGCVRWAGCRSCATR